MRPSTPSSKVGRGLVPIVPLSGITDFLRKWTVSWSIQCGLQRPQGSVLGSLKFIGYTEEPADLPPSQLPFIRRRHRRIASTTMAHAEQTVGRLQQCVAENKTELIWFRSRANL